MRANHVTDRRMGGRPYGSRDRHGHCVRSVPLVEAYRTIAAIGVRIRVIREEQDVRSSELAAALDVDPMTVANWESGRRRPTLANVIRAAVALGVQPGDLVGVDG